jgi:hypothetical protein
MEVRMGMRGRTDRRSMEKFKGTHIRRSDNNE